MDKGMRKRFQVRFPSMSCQKTHLWFNKLAVKLLSIPCSVDFYPIKGGLIMEIVESGFLIRPKLNGALVTSNSRKLIRDFKGLFNSDIVRFEVKTTIKKSTFYLKFINHEQETEKQLRP